MMTPSPTSSSITTITITAAAAAQFNMVLDALLPFFCLYALFVCVRSKGWGQNTSMNNTLDFLWLHVMFVSTRFITRSIIRVCVWSCKVCLVFERRVRAFVFLLAGFNSSKSSERKSDQKCEKWIDPFVVVVRVHYSPKLRPHRPTLRKLKYPLLKS